MNYLFGEDKDATTRPSSSVSTTTKAPTTQPAKHSSSRIRDLLKFLSSVQGDLSNVTAPPFFLAPSSVVEVGHCWAQHPRIFSAPAFEPDASKRALLVLKHILVSLRSQLYIGCVHEDTRELGSVKKPLNAFLGELFLASWVEEAGEHGKAAKVSLVSEQVSHHPPITAMHLIDEENGVRADGYAKVEMGFNGNVDIKQIGHAIMHIDRYDEDYLIPLPNVRVKGYMSGKLYPEVYDTYHLIGSNGYISELRFSGAGLVSGSKNTVSARLYHKSEPAKTLYEVSGCWSGTLTFKDSLANTLIESWDPTSPENYPSPMTLKPLPEQDPWESRRAWAAVRKALQDNDFRAVVREKSKVEQAQRDMRASERQRGKKWKPLLFKSMKGQEYEEFWRLTEGFDDWRLCDERTLGVWRVDEEKLRGVERPFRRELTPDGS
ncbi:hypothetical protein NLU13_6990 [Sarocladium strictum]|uniref:Oxysterol-binding protein n=1 Tax=Sarocladium strictum TaxID=5046 RepID=A0AA39GFN4_SARSR|nr:hypothetical protein NLU13_6990 [Sarocladium strictum]